MERSGGLGKSGLVRKVWAGWAKIQGEFYNRFVFFNFKGFLILASLWKFLQGDLGGILIWGFFLNSSRLFKDFRKIEYAMPCNAYYARLFLEGFSYA
jgi:hypothetical protein